MTDTTRAWRQEAYKKLDSVRGLADKHANFAAGREELRLVTALALEDAVDRLVIEGINLSQSIGGATDRLVAANGQSVEAAGKLTDDLIKAIHGLTDASNSNTALMSRLQRWLIALTFIYVALTAVIAWATYIAAAHTPLGSP